MKSLINRAALMALLALLTLLPSVASAQQTGRIIGQVAAQDGQAVRGAYIVVMGTRHGVVSDHNGRFAIANVPAGKYAIHVSHISFKDAHVADIEVRAGADAAIAPILEAQPLSLNQLVASASRQAQKVTDAPATVTKLDADMIANSVGNSFSGALKEVKGIDFIQVGVTASAINARGFNSSFNNRMLMIEDGRIAVLPENGLPVGTFTTIPKIDLASVEVLIGPGAALYGADASNGVITLSTKDARRYPGGIVEASGGSNAFKDIQARWAGASGRWGYKVSGEHLSANDWSNAMRYGATAVPGSGVAETGVGGKVDWTSRVSRGNASAYYYLNDRSTLEITSGISVSDGVGQTNVGRNQLAGWKYNVAQVKFTTPAWYFNAYRTQSQAGKSYALNRFTTNKAANPSKSDEEIRLMSDWPSDGQMYAAEIQNNLTVRQLNNARIVWGGQVRRDIVSSDRQWLLDRLTGKALTISQKGIYAQLDASLPARLNLVAAARYDDHQNYAAQFSPKVGLVYKPVDGSALRITYNRAFKSPTTLQTSFWIPDFQPVLTAQVGVYGNTRGFTVQNAAGATVRSFKPLVPERNTTWEAGYKGLFGDKFLVDIAGYHSKYANFMSPLTTIANGLAGDVAYFSDTNQRIDTPTARQIVLTYFNLGDATLNGVDAGLKWLPTKNLDVSGTFSWTDLKSVEKPKDVVASDAAFNEATALNSPVIKWTVGANAMNVLRNLSAGFTTRHVTGYRFISGINNGWVPTFNTLDLNFSYALPALRTAINASVVNAFSCVSQYDVDFATKARTVQQSKCGFDERHREMINMPAIGTMAFIGLRVTR